MHKFSRPFSTGIPYSSLLKSLDINVSSSSVIPGVFDGREWNANGKIVNCINPSNDDVIAKVQLGSADDMKRCIDQSASKDVQQLWRNTPAPLRGAVVRDIGVHLREKLVPLGQLISLEMGKVISEGIGEVQEYIDICEFATGLSRTMEGLVLPSERKEHVLMEVYNPLGTIGIITAFNFPCAVAGWNTAISLVCGNTQVIKGSETTNLVNIATQKIVIDALKKHNLDTRIATLCQGTGKDVGEHLLQDKRINLVSFTGSTAVGKHVQNVVGDRFGRVLLELGGNNAIIVSENVDDHLMQNALTSVLFAAVGTCGQRCTSLRRLIVHDVKFDQVKEKLISAYGDINSGKKRQFIGDPMLKSTLVGPLHSRRQVELFKAKCEEAVSQGGKIIAGGKVINGNFVQPTLIEIDASAKIVFEENFVPILYLLKANSLDEAIDINNSVDQGLSCALFTNNMQDVFKWTGPNGSDTGIINVNTGCSGAEIGGAFGGNKSTGGGRESGSDAWKQYMRRGTCTINHGKGLPLAQGISFNTN